MDSAAAMGRRIVVVICAALLTISFLVIVAFNLMQGSEHLPLQLFRLLLTAGLCGFLYFGANWARLVAGILYSLSGVMGCFSGLVAALVSPTGLLLLLMGLVYAVSGGLLLFNRTVRAHFDASS